LAWDQFELSKPVKRAFPAAEAFLEKQQDGSYRLETKAYEAAINAEGLLSSLSLSVNASCWLLLGHKPVSMSYGERRAEDTAG
jgi:hypothetical protein